MDHQQRPAAHNQNPSQDGETPADLMPKALEYHRAGRLEDARQVYARILVIDPRHVDSLHLSGLVALALSDYKTAEDLIRRALAISNSFLFHGSLGSALKAQGRIDDAIASFERSLALKSDFPDVLNNLGSTLSAQGRTEEAKILYTRALAADPNHADTLVNMGLILQEEKKYDDAIAHYNRAIAAKPAFPEAHFNLGNALKAQGKIDAAIKSYLQTIAIKPLPDAHINLGAMLFDQNKLRDAISHFEAAIKLGGASLGALNNLGMTYNAMGEFENAIICCERALQLDPQTANATNTLNAANKNMAMALSTLSTTYKSLGRMDDAIAMLRRALTIAPDYVVAYNNIIVTMIYAASVSPDELMATARQFGDHIADPLQRKRPFANDRNPDRKLRIGYVSPDFRNHAVSYFIESLLGLHDSERFEIFAYSNTENEDAITERLKQKVDHWRNIQFMDDDAAADLVESDQIDILIDLTGHTARNRLLLFARKPAPIQASWLGHPATTGMKAMDYRITDIHAEPPGMTEHLNVETLWRLPEIFCCYQPHENSPAVIDHPPFEDNGYITFGCFNNFAKVTDPVLETWAKIMTRVPDSRLLLEITGVDHPKFQADVEKRLHDFGFPSGRVILEPRRKANQFVLYNKIDMALDPFPCNGGTTSMDTVWMGVPFIALAGQHFVSRMGATILTNAGLSELIAQNMDEYIDIAVKLANDRARLKKMRHKMRDRVAASPVMNQQSFTRNMEAAYRGMWQAWCKTHG